MKMSRVGLSPAEEKRSGTYSEVKRKKNMKHGGMTQGYKAREDESLGMRTVLNGVNLSQWLQGVMSLMEILVNVSVVELMLKKVVA